MITHDQKFTLQMAAIFKFSRSSGGGSSQISVNLF